MKIDLAATLIRWGVYPAMKILRGNRIMDHLHTLRQTEMLTAEQLTALQAKKLQQLLEHCNAQVPAYRHRWSADEIVRDPVRCLRQLPLLDKASFRDDPERYVADDADRSKLIPNRTGGSTGEPVRFYMDRHTVEQYEAARWRGLSWWGIRPWSRSIMVWGSPIELDRANEARYRRRELWLKNRMILPAYRLKAEEVGRYVQLIDRYRPDYLYGYGGALASLAQLLQQAGDLPHHRVKVVIYTAEGMTAEDRQLVSQVFRAPVAGEYGARDGGILAFECPQGNLHLTAENVFLEVVDPCTGEPADTGLILVTDLNNYVQPRLRYVLGDWGALAPTEERCSCGRGLPLLAALEGREDAMFLAADGSLVHGHLAAHVARETPGVKQIQVVQFQPDRFQARLVVEEDIDRNEVAESITAGLRRWLGDVRVEVEFVPSIAPAASGKYRYAIRQFPLGDSTAAKSNTDDHTDR